MKIRWKFYFCVVMEKTPELTYLKRITIIFLVLFTFFMLATLLESVCSGMIYSGKSFHSDKFRLFLEYEGRLYFGLNVCAYILHLVFLLIANSFVKKRLGEKGTHFLMVLLAFLPIANYFLRYIIWRRLNRQVFNYSGVAWIKSDRKIKAIWILTLTSETLGLLLPFLMPFFYRYMTVTEIGEFSMFRIFIITICQLFVSIFYFLYYLEFKKVLYKAQLPLTVQSSLLDD